MPKCAQCGKPATVLVIAAPHPNVDFCDTHAPTVWDLKNYRDPRARARNSANYDRVWGSLR